MGVEPIPVEIRDLGYRWGSCSSRGKLLFHWRTVLLPPRIIEYIVAHELTHLVHRKHDPAFLRTLGRCMPDYQARKEWLAERGGHYY